MHISVQNDWIVVNRQPVPRCKPGRPWFDEPELKNLLQPAVKNKQKVILFSENFCQKAAQDYRRRYLTNGFWGSPMRFPTTTSSFVCGNFSKLLEFEGSVLLVSTSFLAAFKDKYDISYSLFIIELGDNKSGVEIECLNT